MAAAATGGSGPAAATTPTATTRAAATLEDATEELGRKRFVLELEFVQLLADPDYLHYLATQAYLTQAAFVAYLLYLYSTWRQPAYARHLLYPQSLAILRALVVDADYRSALADPAVIADMKRVQAAAAPAASFAVVTAAAAAAAEAAAAAVAAAAGIGPTPPAR